MTNEEAIKALKRIRDESINNFVGDWQDYEAFDIALKALTDCTTESSDSKKSNNCEDEPMCETCINYGVEFTDDDSFDTCLASECKYEPKDEPQTCANGCKWLTQDGECTEPNGECHIEYRTQVDEPQRDEEYINNLPWTEAGNGEQTDIEIARAIVHKMIDDAVIAEDAYPDLRQKMHDAVDNYEPQTERDEKCRL